MPRKQKKYHFIYKTTNKINEKFYVGMHSTDNLNDGYIGSGKRLKRSINKYGKENFKFEILEYLSDRSNLEIREKEIVNEQFLQNSLCMNLMVGGKGGGSGPTEEIRQNGLKAFRYRIKNDINFLEKLQSRAKLNLKNAWSSRKRDSFLGKHHTQKHKNAISKIMKEKQSGNKNSQYGTMWITNGIENKKIKKTDKIPELWISGRTIKC